MYCREIAKSLIEENYFEDPSFQKHIYSIRMLRGGCGHYEFTDGQHRTCIAKHLNINSMYVNVEDELEYECEACRWKKGEKSPLWYRFLHKLKFKKKERPSTFLDEDYMNYRTDSTFINDCLN